MAKTLWRVFRAVLSIATFIAAAGLIFIMLFGVHSVVDAVTIVLVVVVLLIVVSFQVILWAPEIARSKSYRRSSL
jgi:hypothetical protein